jgi:hypothetical protein
MAIRGDFSGHPRGLFRAACGEITMAVDNLFLEVTAAGLSMTSSKDVDSGNSDGLTSHERFLDGCRVAVTGLLILALFVIIYHVSTTATSSATPYISLLSGLAGIALGWMFTSIGSLLV